jgi:predicted GIY-YIG superfamily endonuclease
METLYILECEDNKWYVGKTNDVQRRFKQHTEGKGSEWTREYAPLRIAETRPITSVHDENNVTKDLMKKYGIDNVRGGAYASVDLPEETEDMIRHELRAASDACYKCGKKGHFANRCPKKEEEEMVWCCDYCNREFSTERLASVHEQGCKFKKVAASAARQKLMGSGGGVCYRCGRAGHYSPDCYARTHLRGYELDD